MKNFYLLLIGTFLHVSTISAQGDLCIGAVVLPGSGSYVADGPSTGGGCFNCIGATHADWYSFTAPSNGTMDIATCFGGVDTRFWVYDGSCGTLNQIAAADDECDMGNGNFWASEALNIPATNGVTYYIEFDDRWSSIGFTWNFTFNVNPCITPASFPYSENFDGVSPNLPLCWSTNNPTEVTTTGSCAGSNNESLQVNGVIGAYAYSPVIDVSSQSAIQVSYLYRAGDNTACTNQPEAGDNLNVDYWNGIAWVNLANYDGATAPNIFTQENFIITTGLTNTFQLRFESQFGSGSNFDNYNFDDLSVQVPSPCFTAVPLPFSESFDGVAPGLPTCWSTNDTAVVTTTPLCAGSNNESLQLKGVIGAYAYSPIIDASTQSAIQVSYMYRAGDNTGCGELPDPGDNIDVDYWDGSTWVNLANYDGATAPHVFTPETFIITNGLTSAFQLRFITVFGSGPTFDNYNFDDLVIQIPSPCLIPVSLPYSENFDGVAPGLPTCWSTNNSTEVITTSLCTGSNNESLQVNGVIGAYAYSPIIDASNEVAIQVSFLYRAGDNLGCTDQPEPDDSLHVDYWNGASWVTLANYNGATAPTVFTLESFFINSGLTNAFQLRFISASGSGSNLDNYNFDDLLIQSSVSCVPPSNLVATNISSTSAYLSWTENGLATIWQVEWDTAGFVLGTGSSITTSANPLTLSTLLPNTDYDFYVRSICSPVDTSLWSVSSSFTTLMVGIDAFPIITDLTIYPNPNNGVFTLSFASSNISELEIKVVNIHGQIVYINNNFDKISKINEQIDLCDKGKGVYFLSITSNGGTEIRKIIIY